MGKLLRKLLHGIVPSWLYAGFKHKKLLHFRLRHGIHFISSKSSAPTSPYSSSPLNTELVALLMDRDQDIYYYSQSEDEQEHPNMTGNSKHTSSIGIRSESQVDDDDRGAHCHHAYNQLPASHDDSTKENMGICAPLAAPSIMEGRLQEDKHEQPIAATNMELKYATSAASIILQSQHDDHHHDQHACHSHQRQENGYHDQSHANQHPQHDAGNGPQCQAHHYHDDDCHVHQYNHDHQIYGTHHNQLCATKHGIIMRNRGSHPRTSLTASANKGNYQHDNSHHQHYQQDKEHHADDYQPQQPHHRLGSKRKSMCLDEDDVKKDGKDNQSYHCSSMRTGPCLKRQKGANVRCELPERICEMVGNGSAVVQYSYQDPHFAFWESMVDMIVSNGLWDVGKLEFLLHCYLTLNDPHLHHAIHTSFLQVLKDLQPA